jgi:hypothetical protein
MLEGPMFEKFRAFFEKMTQAIMSDVFDMCSDQSMINAEPCFKKSTAFSVCLRRNVWL